MIPTNRNLLLSILSSFLVHARAGGAIALWKSVVITVKVQIGGAAAQIELREVADKRRLYAGGENKTHKLHTHTQHTHTQDAHSTRFQSLSLCGILQPLSLLL
jgi:hypothetical protein